MYKCQAGCEKSFKKMTNLRRHHFSDHWLLDERWIRAETFRDRRCEALVPYSIPCGKHGSMILGCWLHPKVIELALLLKGDDNLSDTKVRSRLTLLGNALIAGGE